MSVRAAAGAFIPINGQRCSRSGFDLVKSRSEAVVAESECRKRDVNDGEEKGGGGAGKSCGKTNIETAGL